MTKHNLNFFPQEKAECEHHRAASTFLPAGGYSVPGLCNMCAPKMCFKLALCAFGNCRFIVDVSINYCSCLIPLLLEMVPDNPDKQPHSDRAYRCSCKDGSGSGLGHTGPWPILHSSKQITPVYIFLLYPSLGRRPIATFTVTDSIWARKIYFPFLTCSRMPLLLSGSLLKVSLAEGFSAVRQKPFQNNRAMKQWKVKGLTKGIKVQ